MSIFGLSEFPVRLPSVRGRPLCTSMRCFKSARPCWGMARSFFWESPSCRPPNPFLLDYLCICARLQPGAGIVPVCSLCQLTLLSFGHTTRRARTRIALNKAGIAGGTLDWLQRDQRDFSYGALALAFFLPC
mgnify:CR=1 FL=1